MSNFMDKAGLSYFWNKIKNMFVAKETGKGLSTNDYTTTEKNKLAGIANNANNYSLPTASSSTLGGIKVGSGLSISNGVLSASSSGFKAQRISINFSNYVQQGYDRVVTINFPFNIKIINFPEREYSSTSYYFKYPGDTWTTSYTDLYGSGVIVNMEISSDGSKMTASFDRSDSLNNIRLTADILG